MGHSSTCRLGTKAEGQGFLESSCATGDPPSHLRPAHPTHCLRVGPRSRDTALAPPRWTPKGGNKHVSTLVLNSRVNRLTGEAEQGAPPAAGQDREEETDAVLHLVMCEQDKYLTKRKMKAECVFCHVK